MSSGPAALTGKGGLGVGRAGLGRGTDRVREVGHGLDVQQLLKDEVQLLVCALTGAAGTGRWGRSDELWAQGQEREATTSTQLGPGPAGAPAVAVYQ